MRVKNLWINSWCPTCKKAKGYSCTFSLGGYPEDDPDAVETPDTCTCNFYLPQPRYFNTWQSSGVILLPVSGV